MSRRGICHIWFRGRHISPSMPYREGRVGSGKQRRANCVQKRSHGPKSRDDSFGTTLQRRCLEVLRFSLLFKHSVSACADVLAFRYQVYQKNINMLVFLGFFFFFVAAIDISADYIGRINIR